MNLLSRCFVCMLIRIETFGGTLVAIMWCPWLTGPAYDLLSVYIGDWLPVENRWRLATYYIISLKVAGLNLSLNRRLWLIAIYHRLPIENRWRHQATCFIVSLKVLGLGLVLVKIENLDQFGCLWLAVCLYRRPTPSWKHGDRQHTLSLVSKSQAWV